MRPIIESLRIDMVRLRPCDVAVLIVRNTVVLHLILQSGQSP
jgi:hypothetical protein